MTRTPLYLRVEEALADRISHMRVGDMIPPEPDLEREFKVSRATVRRAVENLVISGVLEKRQGLGTIVRDHPETQDVGQVYSWTAEMRRRHVETSSSHLTIQRQKPGRQLAKELRIDADENLVVISRVRSVKDVPVVVMVNYLREHYVPGLVERGLQGESLYDELLDVYGLHLIGGDETINAREATAIEASLLRVPEGSALLNVRRISMLRGNIPFEVVNMAARGDKYQYHAKLSGGSATRTRR
jgi:GntR family transcriptional regulator